MTRSLKAAGLALVVALAMSSLAASGAQAASHHFDQVGTISAKASTNQVIKPVTEGEKRLECSGAAVAAGAEVIEEGKALTVEPSYSGCKAIEPGKELSLSVRPNGCHFRFTGVTTAGNPTGGEHATVHVICPPGQEIETRVTALNLKCLALPPQGIKDAIRYQEDLIEPERNSEVTFTAHGFETTTLPGTANCSGSPEVVIDNNGTYTGSLTVENVRLTTDATP